MRPVPNPSHARRGPRSHPLVALFVPLILGILPLGACSVSETQRVVDRARLVNDLASRLDRSGTLTYTAEYRLAGGGQASIIRGKEPTRTAYRYPGGTVLILPDGVVSCTGDTAPTCMIIPPLTPGTAPPESLLSGATGSGMVLPTTVISLLTAASLDDNAVIKQHDSTIAGQHASCVDVTGVDNAAASAFSACITTDGILASFSGNLDTNAVDVELTHYTESFDPEAFDTPAGAKVTDQRPA